MHYYDLILNRIEQKKDEIYLTNSFLDDTSARIFKDGLFNSKAKNHFKNRIENIIMNNEVKNSKELEMLNYTYEVLK